VTEMSPPLSPIPAGRPPIPVVPATFAAPSPPLEKKSIDIPRGDPEVFESVAPARNVDEAQPPALPTGRPPVPSTTAPPPPAKLPPPMPAHETSVDDDVDWELRGGAPAPPRTALPPPPPTVEPSASATIDDGAAEEASAIRSEPTASESQAAPTDEFEDEDPEIARRRAIAARMAKLGGVNMRMPMFGAIPVGGPPKPAKKKSIPAPEEEHESTAQTEVTRGQCAGC
jgi:hypothetical protein